MDFRKIQAELESQFKRMTDGKSSEEIGLVGVIHGACIPVIVQALELYHEQMSQEKNG